MNLKNLVLGIGIVIVFALVLWQGIETFYPSPQWDNFCEDNAIFPGYQEKLTTLNQTFCEENGGRWRNNYCDYYAECQDAYDSARDERAQTAFFISLIVAIIAVILGYSILKVEPVGSALIASGIWAIFYGSVINWRNFSDILRFTLLLVVLVLLVWLTMQMNRKK